MVHIISFLVVQNEMKISIYKSLAYFNLEKEWILRSTLESHSIRLLQDLHTLQTRL